MLHLVPLNMPLIIRNMHAPTTSYITLYTLLELPSQPSYEKMKLAVYVQLTGASRGMAHVNP